MSKGLIILGIKTWKNDIFLLTVIFKYLTALCYNVPWLTNKILDSRYL